ncbi:MAG: peptidylprolyl isomerase, partial [Dehalococcoidaceae bacterium]|nr:peptidylprolyl isomerase [Dehalococcoidaceae bacterium]
HLSNLQKQKRRQKIILFSGIATVAAAAVFVILGLIFQWYIPKIKPLSEVVIEVNGTSYKMSYLVDSLKYQTQGQSEMIIPYFVDPVANSIIQAELTRQYADELGYTVSSAEIDDALKEYTGKINPAIRDYVRNYLLQQKLIDEYFKAQLPDSAEHREAYAMFLESESQADEVIERLENGELFETIATELSLDDFTEENSGKLGFHPGGIIVELAGSQILEDAVFENQTGYGKEYEENKNKNVGYWLIEILERRVEKETEQARARVMLLSSEEEAVEVKSLLAGGGDFDALAEEYSLMWDEDGGAELDWFAEGDISHAFDDYVFNSENTVGSVSQPVKDVEQTTKGGWWLFDITRIENSAISDDDADILAYRALRDWLEEIGDNPDNVVNNYLDQTRKDYAVEMVLG